MGTHLLGQARAKIKIQADNQLTGEDITDGLSRMRSHRTNPNGRANG